MLQADSKMSGMSRCGALRRSFTLCPSQDAAADTSAEGASTWYLCGGRSAGAVIARLVRGRVPKLGACILRVSITGAIMPRFLWLHGIENGRNRPTNFGLRQSTTECQSWGSVFSRQRLSSVLALQWSHRRGNSGFQLSISGPILRIFAVSPATLYSAKV